MNDLTVPEMEKRIMEEIKQCCNNISSNTGLEMTVIYPTYAAGTLPKSIILIFEALDESFIEFQATFPEKQVIKVMPTPNQ
jgi:hypothetical protein